MSTDEIRRVMGNFCNVSSYETSVTTAELETIKEKYDVDCMIVNGRVRKLCWCKDTDREGNWKLWSQPA